MVNEVDIERMLIAEMHSDENLLWKSKGHHVTKKKNIGIMILGWAIVVLWLSNCLLTAWTRSQSEEPVAALFWVIMLLASIWLGVMLLWGDPPKPDKAEIYAITDKRIIALNKRGDISTVYNRPFFSLSLENHDNGFSSLHLYGPGVDDEIFVFSIENVLDGEAARKLTESRFFDKRTPPHE